MPGRWQEATDEMLSMRGSQQQLSAGATERRGRRKACELRAPPSLVRVSAFVGIQIRPESSSDDVRGEAKPRCPALRRRASFFSGGGHPRTFSTPKARRERRFREGSEKVQRRTEGEAQPWWRPSLLAKFSASFNICPRRNRLNAAAGNSLLTASIQLMLTVH